MTTHRQQFKARNGMATTRTAGWQVMKSHVTWLKRKKRKIIDSYKNPGRVGSRGSLTV